MADFLLELASEEIPARMQAAAAEQLRLRFGDGIKGRVPGDIEVTTFVTPRRLALYATGLGAHGNTSVEERRGPRADAPAAAIEGFLRSTGLTRDSLEERDTPKGRFLYATILTEGRPTADLLAELVPTIVAGFDWPKSMRWGAASASTASPRWVRPLTHIVALLNDSVVPFEAAGIASGRTTRGHRFMHPAPVEIGHARDYAETLRRAFVIVDPAERRARIVGGAAAATHAAGLTLIEDPGLLDENAGLTEWPVPLLGRFDPAFLDVPREVIQLTMRTNQKYFACAGPDGSLAPAFVCVANLDATDGGAAIVAGNERVLSARLSDAKFFWDADVAKVKEAGLEAFTPKLDTIVFHEKLGTLADKVERVAKLARWLIESGAISSSPLAGRGTAEGGGGAAQPSTPLLARDRPSTASRSPSPLRGEELADLAERAARLAKADLVTATVGEFPEVQGIAGRYLALAAGEDARVANAIRDHYKPVGPSDTIPSEPVSVAVALADKLDTLLAFFEIGELPTGSRDPFALRRAALGAIAILTTNGIRLPLAQFSGAWIADAPKDHGDWQGQLLDFLADRLKVQQREAGVRHDLIGAVFALGGEDDLVRLLARVRALQAFIGTEDGANLLAGYRRAANILRDEEKKDGRSYAVDLGAPLSKYIGEAEKNLARLFARAEETGAALIFDELDDLLAREDFVGAMSALARLRAPVDAFFEGVMVNDPDPEARARRLGLLAGVRAAMHKVADFSKIEG